MMQSIVEHTTYDRREDSSNKERAYHFEFKEHRGRRMELGTGQRGRSVECGRALVGGGRDRSVRFNYGTGEEMQDMRADLSVGSISKKRTIMQNMSEAKEEEKTPRARRQRSIQAVCAL